MSKRREYDSGTTEYAPDEWYVIEKPYNPKSHAKNEAIFAIGNGYIGMRASFEEGYGGPEKSIRGVFLNGFYERHQISYPESAFGLAKYDDTMLNVTDCLPIHLKLEGEEFSMFRGTLLDYSRLLCLRSGKMSRSVAWRSPNGREVQLIITRMCSQTNKHLAVINYAITPLNFDGRVEISSSLDGKVRNLSAADDPRVGASVKGQTLQTIWAKQDGTYAALEQRTPTSGFFMVCAMENSVEGANVSVEEVEHTIFDEQKEVRFSFHGTKGNRVVLTKYIAYVTSRDYERDEINRHARNVVTAAKAKGFAWLEAEQSNFYDAFWSKADVEIRGSAHLQQGIRFNLFHLVQSMGRDGRTNIAAKGLTGEGYNGHYFWDAEVYVMPFFLYTNPSMAKPLLLHRFHTLGAARRRARDLDICRGCLFPWRTICGEECSSFFPAGTAQVHINADIAYCFKSYISATNDVDFMVQYGAEVVFETARAWIELGTWHMNGTFQIHGVTGVRQRSLNS